MKTENLKLLEENVEKEKDVNGPILCKKNHLSDFQQ